VAPDEPPLLLPELLEVDAPELEPLELEAPELEVVEPELLDPLPAPLDAAPDDVTPLLPEELPPVPLDEPPPLVPELDPSLEPASSCAVASVVPPPQAPRQSEFDSANSAQAVKVRPCIVILQSSSVSRTKNGPFFVTARGSRAARGAG
jgi:hypothetical protein